MPVAEIMMMGLTIFAIGRNLILIAVDVKRLAGSGRFMRADYLSRMDNRPARKTREQAQCGKKVEQAKHAAAF
jgi:hypothetical protein